MEDVAKFDRHLRGPVAALRLDADGRIADATEAAATMLGMTSAELQGKTLGDLVVDHWKALAESATARILCGDDRAFQLLLRASHGRRILVQMASCKVSRSERPSYVLDWSEPISVSPTSSGDGDALALQRLADGLLRAQEAERKRVASQLENGVAPLVLKGKHMIENLVQQAGGTEDALSVETLQGASTWLRQALGEIQTVAATLRPKMLDELGVVHTIEWHCRSFERRNSAVRIDRQLAVGESEIPDHLKLVIFRLVEEALANVAQHANASEAQVALLRAEDELLSWVQDNGEGIDAANPVGAAGMAGIGLACIRRRIEDSGGRFSLQSSKREGTRVGAAWPLHRHAEGGS